MGCWGQEVEMVCTGVVNAVMGDDDVALAMGCGYWSNQLGGMIR